MRLDSGAAGQELIAELRSTLERAGELIRVVEANLQDKPGSRFPQRTRNLFRQEVFMSEKEPQTSAETSVPPISDDSYDPPPNAIGDPVGGPPIIDRPPFDGGDDER